MTESAPQVSALKCTQNVLVTSKKDGHILV